MAKSKELETVVSFAGKVDPSLSSSAIKAGKEMKKFQAQMKKVGTNILKGIGNIAKGIGVGLASVAITAGVAIGGFAAQGIALASDLQEVQNVVQTTFGESEGIINRFAETALDKFGISELSAKKFTGTLGAMLKSMKVDDEQMLIMSQNLTALSGDLASFYNLDAAEAFDKIRAGISGETEPLKQLGINMSVNNLEEFAKAQGESKKFSDMTQAEQAIIRYGYLMETAADAQGDFDKTKYSFSNQQKLLKQNFEQLSGRIMQGMLPALSEVMIQLNEFMSALDIEPFVELVAAIGEIILESLPLINQILPLLTSSLLQIAPLFVTLLQALMPIVNEILPIFLSMLTMLMPFIAQLAEALMPILSILLMSLMEALGPLIPIFTEVVEILTPFWVLLAKIVGGLIEFLGVLASGLFGTALEVLKNIASFFGFGKKETKDSAEGMTAYANGGFASTASIFGEAGLEAAIPIKKGDPNSLALLAKTAALLGVKSPLEPKPFTTATQSTYVLEYKPQIYGNAAEAEPILRRDYSKIKEMFDEFIEERERVCYG